MTRASAAALLSDLADGDQTEYGQALRVAVLALVPKPRAPKVSPHVAAFLKMRFPVQPAKPTAEQRDRWWEIEQEMPQLARNQFTYGQTGRKLAPDAAVLAGARA